MALCQNIAFICNILTTTNHLQMIHCSAFNGRNRRRERMTLHVKVKSSLDSFAGMDTKKQNSVYLPSIWVLGQSERQVWKKDKEVKGLRNLDIHIK